MQTKGYEVIVIDTSVWHTFARLVSARKSIENENEALVGTGGTKNVSKALQSRWNVASFIRNSINTSKRQKHTISWFRIQLCIGAYSAVPHLNVFPLGITSMCWYVYKINKLSHDVSGSIG